MNANLGIPNLQRKKQKISGDIKLTIPLSAQNPENEWGIVSSLLFVICVLLLHKKFSWNKFGFFICYLQIYTCVMSYDYAETF